MFGHAGPPATDPDFVALRSALAAFGGHGMTSTLMDEVRTQARPGLRRLLTLSERRGAGAVAGWVFSSNDKVVATLKLVLKLYVSFMDKGLEPARVAIFKRSSPGPTRRRWTRPSTAWTRVSRPRWPVCQPDFVDTFADRVRAVTAPARSTPRSAKHVRARDLAITMVSTASVMKKLLVDAKIKDSAIDVVASQHD